jgi:hypothetical protein
MLGNPFGIMKQVGSGVAGAVQGVSRGIVRGDGDQIVRGGKNLLGTVVGAAAGLGARFTGSLYTLVQRFLNALAERDFGAGGTEVADSRLSLRRLDQAAASSSVAITGGALLDVRRGLQLPLKDAMKEEAKAALRRLERSLAKITLGLLGANAPGAPRNGTFNFARGVADGALNLVLLPIAATLETGAVVLHTVEQARRPRILPSILTAHATALHAPPSTLHRSAC